MDYPNNSDAARSNRHSISEESRASSKPVAHGAIKRKGAMGKFMDIFVKRSFEDAVKDAIEDRLIPAILDGAYNMISDTVGMMFYGDAYEAPRRENRRSDNRRDYADRSRRESRSNRSRSDDSDTRHERSVYREIAEASHITYDTKDEALDVIDSLWDAIDDHKFATVAYFYEVSGIKTDNYTLDDYGWTSMRDVRPRMNMDGRWKITLPRPLPIDRIKND